MIEHDEVNPMSFQHYGAGPPLQLRLLTSFQDAYVRNNKGTCQKNVRCFPQCSPTGHHGNSFCGSSISLEVILRLARADDPSPSARQLAALRLYGQLVPSSGEPLAVTSMGSHVPADYIEKLCLDNRCV